MHRLPVISIFCSVIFGWPSFASAQTSDAGQALTLQEAVTRGVQADVGLRAAGAGIDAARGTLQQARVRPNPELSIEAENFSGNRALRGFQGAESTVALSQEVQINGERRARILLADRELHGAELDYLLRGLDLIRDVQLAYYDSLMALELVRIEGERLATAQSLGASISKRVAAARDPLMASASAQAGIAEARIAFSRAQAQQETTRARLVSVLGGDNEFVLVLTHFEIPAALDHGHATPSETALDAARLIAHRDRAVANAAVERSLSRQNPKVSLGYRRFENGDGDGALIAGVSIPLGIFDRNQGGIARADAERRRAELELEAARHIALRDFQALERALANDMDAVRGLENDVIPQAQRALTLAQDGYQRGAFTYLDIREAQRVLSDARQRRVEALRSYHTNEAALDRLTGRFVDLLDVQEIH